MDNIKKKGHLSERKELFVGHEIFQRQWSVLLQKELIYMLTCMWRNLSTGMAPTRLTSLFSKVPALMWNLTKHLEKPTWEPSSSDTSMLYATERALRTLAGLAGNARGCEFVSDFTEDKSTGTSFAPWQVLSRTFSPLQKASVTKMSAYYESRN